jgi:hypothetical protein
MNRIVSLAAAALLAGCATPGASGERPAPEGSAVALGHSVRVGQLVATPQTVVEDSRCPRDVRCVWAGRLVVSTRIDGPDWRETAALTLGKADVVRGASITLVSVTPEKRAGGESPLGDYRFTFDGGR